MRLGESGMRWGMRGVVSALCAMACAAASAGETRVAAKFESDTKLVVEFAEAMRTWDNGLRDDVVRVTPALSTRCAWDSDTRLTCQLESTRADATRYRIDVEAGLKTQGGQVLRAQHIWVETRRPQLSARVERWSVGMPSIVVAANMPIDAQAVRAALRVHVDGKPLKVALHPLPPTWSGDRNVRFALVLPDIARDKRTLAVDVLPGLRALPGPLRGEQKARLLAARLREPFALRAVTCAGRGKPAFVPAKANAVEAACVPGSPVLLVFTRTLDEKSLDALRARLPAGMTVSPGWEGEVRRDTGAMVEPTRPVHLSSPEPNVRLEFELDGSIRSIDGAVLPATAVRIITGDAQPQIRAMEGGALVADGSKPPVLVELLNAKAASLQVSGVARQHGSETVHAMGQLGTATPIGSAVASRTLAEGGWVRWSTGERGSRWSARANEVEFAAPGFDLLAVAGRREVLAWANEWDRDAPVAGAEVELLWRDRDDAEPRVAARGRTGADGTVLLRLSDDLVIARPTDEASRWDWSGPSWLLRAVDAGHHRRAVLPVGETSDGQSTGLAPARKAWGVSDRPLYRAGDTVHYRLWQRERRGVHLRVARPEPVKLRLFDTEREKAVLEWQATPDAEGSIAADLALPVHLTDATYCIGVDAGHGDTDGTCFFVGSYRAQDLWVEAKSKGGVLRDGDRYVADVRAGYFSGGAAASAEAEPLSVTLWPLPLAEAYPRYQDFTFVDVDDDDTDAPDLAGVPSQARLDSEGGLHIDVPVAFDGDAKQRPAFATLSLEVQVSPADREGTTGSDQVTRYARFDRYVGLQASPQWFGRDDKVSVETVVITAHGQAVPADVEIVVEYAEDFGSEAPGERLARCVVRTGVVTPCDFPRRRSGIYRLIARSGDAAPARLTQYVWTGDAGIASDVDEPGLTVLDASPLRTDPVRVLVKQNFERARALFVVANGDTILGHRVETLVGNVRNVALPVSRNWRGRLGVEAYIREAATAQVVGGYRKPVPVEVLEATVVEAQREPPKAPVAVRFQPSSAKPGTQASLVLRNDTRQPRSVTVAVTDDALRAQAQRWLPYADPLGGSGFASWLDAGTRGTHARSFADWTGGLWQSLLPWSEMAVAATEAGALPPPPEQPPVELEDPSPVDAPAAAPGVMRNRSDGYGESTTLDRIQVTGSRIRRTDIVESNEAKAPDPSLGPRQESEARAAKLQSVRSRFADTALWLPAIRLAPGESRRIDIALPDNLTRWRAVAWSTDGADDFAMTEATLEAGLPVEVRLQAPVRLYPGDASRVATSVRHVAATTAVAQTTLEVQGQGANAAETYAQPIALAARGQGSVATTLRPQEPGELHVVASARTTAGGDAVAGTIEVASPLIATRTLQAGWVGEDVLQLDVPALPEAATAPSLRVSLLRGGAGLTSQWTRDLHDYPHRCWEQILSRAVGAALAVERHDPSWPDAAAVVDEALSNAAVFQLDGGGFVYFPGVGRHQPDASVTLTAYTLRAFALLRTLGHAVPERIEANARKFTSRIKAPTRAPRNGFDEDFARFAYAAAEQAPERIADLDSLWSHWDRLPLPVQVASARAFAKAGHPSAPRATQRLLERAPARGAARTLRLPQRYDAWMSSDMREQCAVIELLRDHPELGDALARRQLLVGMNDLYAGGVASVDTQTAASCLMALRTSSDDSGPAQVRFAIGSRERTLELAQGQDRADWDVRTPDGAQLQVAGARGNVVPVSYIAQLDYFEDARTAQASAVGLSIERRYDVLRNGAWAPAEGQALHEGDWIRIALTVRTTATREFVAVTDEVPGGLQPTDLELSGVGTADLKRIADEGSGYFETRKLDARTPHFYAEALPAGDHVLHYFARVGNSGDYLAAPATVELMYGSATYARTAATRLRISEAAPARAGARAN